jgi:2-keto-3-deoxy-L-rhamnonate aldolase RhmA
MAKKSTQGRAWENPNFARTAAVSELSRALLLGRKLRRTTRAGLTLGTFLIELPCSTALMAIGGAGFDFVVIDLEHSGIDYTALEQLIRAAHSSGLAALVRPLAGELSAIGKILDLGANGIMAPHVHNAAQARAIVEQARFPPHGARSFSPISRFDSLRYPLRELGDATYVIVQIEGREGIEQIDAIAAVAGIDAIFVGPYDLALSLDVPPGSPKVFSAAKKATRNLTHAKVAIGIYVDDPSASRTWAKSGFNLQCLSFDGRMLANAARRVLEQARGARAPTLRRRK